MIEIIFDPSQITTTQGVVIGSLALAGAAMTTATVLDFCVKVTKRIFRSEIKAN